MTVDHCEADLTEFEARVFAKISSTSMEFRAAANSSVPETRRPIKQRVLDRVRDLDEFRELFHLHFPSCMARALKIPGDDLRQVWVKWTDLNVQDRPTCETVRELFLATVQADTRFSTLILEAVVNENSWPDLMHGNFSSLLDKCCAFIEKVFDKNHPASRLSASAVLAGFSFLTAYHVAYRIKFISKDLTLPVRLQWDAPKYPVPVKLDLGSNSTELPLKVVATSPLEVRVETHPLKLQIAGADGKVIPENGPSLKDSMNNVDRDLAEIDNQLSTVAIKLDALPKSVATLTTTVHDGNQESAHSVSDGLKSIGNKLSRIDGVARNTDTVLSSVQEPALAFVTSGQDVPTYLHWLNADHGLTQCTLTVTASRIAGDGAQIRLVSLKDCSPKVDTPSGRLWNEPMFIAVNQSERIPGLPYRVTVVSTVHHWLGLGSSRATLRFDPDLPVTTTLVQLASDSNERTEP